MHFHILNGPNLHALGRRSVEHYGTKTLKELNDSLQALAGQLGIILTHFQSNFEGALIDNIYQQKNKNVDGLIINAGAFTHTSIALRDALLATQMRFVEVHISNIFAREKFRHNSYLSDIADGIIVGFGVRGYELAMMALIAKLRDT